MTINYQFRDVDAHGALIRAQARRWGGARSAACQEFISQLGRNFQVIYEQANAHGQ